MRDSPMKIAFREVATPYLAKPRRYPSRKKAFLAAGCNNLEIRKLVKKVSFADWISGPLSVPKTSSEYFTVTKLRPSNFSTEKDERPMPNLEAML